MQPKRVRRVSPAMIVAILALVAGVTGAAVAQPAAKKAVTKKKAKKIADKEIAKLAPGLAVKSATTAASAETANTAGNANTVGGKPASAFQDHCAANTIAVGSSLCLDSTALPTGTYSAALSGCAARGERLPSISELQLAWSRGQLTQAQPVGRYWSDVGYSPASGGGSVSLATLFATASGTVEPLTASSTVPAAVCASSPTNR